MSLKCNLTSTYQGVSMMGKADLQFLGQFPGVAFRSFLLCYRKIYDLGNFNNTQLLTQAWLYLKVCLLFTVTLAGGKNSPLYLLFTWKSDLKQFTEMQQCTTLQPRPFKHLLCTYCVSGTVLNTIILTRLWWLILSINLTGLQGA